jgi:hypothetical protein
MGTPEPKPLAKGITLVGKPFAGATNAALHFVNHEQPVLFVAQCTHIAQVVWTHRVDATFALDGLEEHGHHVGIAHGGFFQRGDVVQGHANETFHQRPKPFLNFFVARGAEGGDAAAMESPLIDHDFWPLNAFVVAEFAGHFQSRFVGFQAGVAKEHLAHPRQLNQLVGQLLLQGDVVVIAAVHHATHLVLQRRGELGVGVSQGVDRDTRQSVQVAFACRVKHMHASAMGHRHGQTTIGVHQVGGGIVGAGHGGSWVWAQK